MLNAAVVVAALGYFVDVYDLILFSVVRVPSLKDMGVPEELIFEQGLYPFHAQMIGMLLGGVLWGVFGDKKGRLSVLFGSIILYSTANILNAFVNDIPTYAALRFLAGIGLAGELGAGVTLVSEILPKDKRGLGTTIVATVGVMGAIFAAGAAELFHWRTCYLIGGVAGFALLILRVSVAESGIYKRLESSTKVKRGDLRMLFGNGPRLLRYLRCVLVGCPIWFALGIFMTFAPEFGKQIGLVDAQGASLVTGANSVFYAYLGLTLGDLASGLVSQWLRSRIKALFLFISITLLASVAFILALPHVKTPEQLYMMLIPIGFGAGYWAVFITTSAEQFGTNLRSTVATSAPNFVRGAAVPITWAFKELTPILGGYINAAVAVGAVVMSLAIVSLITLKESFHADLDFLEL